MQVTNISLKQIPPISNSTAVVQVDFTLASDLPDFVQIYAAPGGGGGVGTGGLAAAINVTAGEYFYSVKISLSPATFYLVSVCPRTGSPQSPDGYIDGLAWESYCAFQNVTTQGISPSPTTLTPPVITNLDPEPATVNGSNTITVTWSSSTTYIKDIVWWTQDGIALEQDEVVNDNGMTGGSWTATTSPGYRYTFQVKGGISAGLAGYTYSEWGPTVAIIAVQNLRSLRQFLQHSGVNPAGASLRSLMPPGDTLKQFMKLS